eukprot:TRINITY_DN14111_c0_g1_i10.p4 TRINITY_DN14111_c0_g1~~TRINITY_DN14111_c0_g1_i10.p4  ORF type:complete len:218 (+),score=28.11 TRINITY_DN14111_c0_g1_i10:142-795(+)
MKIANVVFWLIWEIVRVNSRKLMQGGLSAAIAEVYTNADQSAPIRQYQSMDAPQGSQTASAGIFRGLDRNQLRGVAYVASQIVRFPTNSSAGNGTAAVRGGAQTEVRGLSNSGSGVQGAGGTVLESQATPEAAGLRMRSYAAGQAAGNGGVQLANQQIGQVQTQSGQAGFQTKGQVQSLGDNSEAVIVSNGTAITTQEYSKSTASVCASSQATSACN